MPEDFDLLTAEEPDPAAPSGSLLLAKRAVRRRRIKRIVNRTVRLLIAALVVAVCYRYFRSHPLSYFLNLLQPRPAASRSIIPKPSPLSPLPVSQAGADTMVPQPAPASRPSDAQSQEFVAVRYDDSRVFFFVGDIDPPGRKFPPGPQAIGKPVTDVPDVSLQDVNDEIASSAKTLLTQAPLGGEWQLLGASESPLSVLIEKPIVIRNSDCSAKLGIGFLARITPVGAMQFAASSRNYFVVRPFPQPITSGNDTKVSAIAQLADWAPADDLKSRLEQLLQTRMKDEIPKIRTKVAGAYQSGIDAHKNWPSEWAKYDSALERGQARLDYDVQAYRLTPDGAPRLFIRARWTVAETPVFFMSLWLRSGRAPVVEAEDTSVSVALRTQEYQGNSPGLDALGKVLNVFDVGENGWGDLLIYTPGNESFELRVFHYTEGGPVRKEIAYGDGC